MSLLEEEKQNVEGDYSIKKSKKHKNKFGILLLISFIVVVLLNSGYIKSDNQSTISLLATISIIFDLLFFVLLILYIVQWLQIKKELKNKK